jgi:TM2 domain-containing membrane protein YozV
VTSLALKASLTDRELALLTSEMPNRSKSLVVAFLLWFFLGVFGVYNFYLGNSSRGWLMVVLTIVGFVTFIVIIGIFIIIGLFILWVVDAVRMSSRVQQINAEIESRLISELIAARGPAPAFVPAQ